MRISPAPVFCRAGNWCRETGIPEKSTPALSRPMREDFPAARRAAVNCCFILSYTITGPQDTVCEDARPQAAASVQPLKCAGTQCLVHPITGSAFLHALERHALDFKFAPYEGV